MNRQQPPYQPTQKILRTDLIAYLKKTAAIQEELDNLYSLGVMWYKGKNLEQAFECFDKGYKKGDLRAAYNSAIILLNGEGVTKNVPEAFKRFKLAAEQGHIASMRQVGAMLYVGHDIIEDRLQASQWLAKAAEQGDVDAQHDLGVMYLNGDGVDKDPKKALKWLEKAAKKRHLNAQHIIGTMYLDGDSVDRNLKKAFEWLANAAEEGHMQAQLDLGIIFLEGTYVENNPKKALEYFNMAAAQGNEEAINFLQKFIIDNEEVARNNLQQEEAKKRKEISKKIQRSIKTRIKDNLTKSIIPIITEEVLSRNKLQSREAIERGSLLLTPGIEEEFLIRASLEHQEIKEREELSNRKTTEVNRYIKRQLKNFKKTESQTRDKILQQKKQAWQKLQEIVSETIKKTLIKETLLMQKIKNEETTGRNQLTQEETTGRNQLTQEALSLINDLRQRLNEKYLIIKQQQEIQALQTENGCLKNTLLIEKITNEETTGRNQLTQEALSLINDLRQRLNEKYLIIKQQQEIQALQTKIECLNTIKDMEDFKEAIGLLEAKKRQLLNSMGLHNPVSSKGRRLSDEKRKRKYFLLKTINKTFIEYILNKNPNGLRLKDFIQMLYNHIFSQKRYSLSQIKESLKAGDIIRKLKLIIERYPDLFSIKITHNPYDYKDKYVIAFKEEPSKLNSLCLAPKEKQPPIIFTTSSLNSNNPYVTSSDVNRHTYIAEAKRLVPR